MLYMFWILFVIGVLGVAYLSVWSMVNYSQWEVIHFVSMGSEFLDVVYIFSLGLFLGWYLAPTRATRRDKELRSDDEAPSRPQY